MQRMRGRAGLTIVAVVAMVIGACTNEGTSEGGTGDKAGGPGEPVVLTMATVNGDLDFTPQIQYLLDRVAQLSDGNVQIEIVYEVGDFAPDAEQQVVRGSPTASSTSATSARRASRPSAPRTSWRSPRRC